MMGISKKNTNGMDGEEEIKAKWQAVVQHLQM